MGDAVQAVHLSDHGRAPLRRLQAPSHQIAHCASSLGCVMAATGIADAGRYIRSGSALHGAACCARWASCRHGSESALLMHTRDATVRLWRWRGGARLASRGRRRSSEGSSARRRRRGTATGRVTGLSNRSDYCSLICLTQLARHAWQVQPASQVVPRCRRCCLCGRSRSRLTITNFPPT